MAVSEHDFTLSFGTLSRLTGPIFDKELRISSRKRRSYALRSAYIVFLGLFVIYAWLTTLKFAGGSILVQASRIDIAGNAIISTIVWFQFVCAQLIAVILLSTSIGGEIRQRTFSVLMTTPISNLQIVAGKLLSKLLQVILLLAISLPLLAFLRVLGGVSWDYILSSWCITLTAVVFAGALSLLFSITYRRSYVVVLIIVTGYVIVFGLVPGVLYLLSTKGIYSNAIVDSAVLLLNPFAAMVMRSYVLFSAPSKAAVFFSWPLHCAISLSATGVVLALAVQRVRMAASRQAFGGRHNRPAANKSKPSVCQRNPHAASPVKHVYGPPVVWIETRKHFFGRSKTHTIAYGVLIAIAWVFIFSARLGLPITIVLLYRIMYILMLVVTICMAVCAADSITREKKDRTWPILLTTPLDDDEIVQSKGFAAYRRNLPLLMLVIFLVVFCHWSAVVGGGRGSGFSIFYLIGYIVSLVSSSICAIGLGLYCSIRLQRTGAAVAATIGGYLVLTLLCCAALTPLTGVFLLPTAPGLITWLVSVCAQTAAGLLFLQRAKRRLRRDAFS